MSKQRKKYTKAEKLEIVKQSLSDTETIEQIATRFEVSKQSIYMWRNEYLKDEQTAFPGNGNMKMTESERRINELEKQLKEARLERDILKKAVGIFSKNDKKFSNL